MGSAENEGRRAKGGRGGKVDDSPLNPGNFSRSTLSVTWNLLLLCFLGVFPAMGIVSLGPAVCFSLLPKLEGPPPRPVAPGSALGASTDMSDDDDTTTTGGAGEVLSDGGTEDLRSGVAGGC